MLNSASVDSATVRQTQPAAVASNRILLTEAQAAAAVGVSIRKFHQLRKEHYWPRPILLGPRLFRWSRAELEAAVEHMPRQEEASAEPHQLLRSRLERMKREG